VVSVVKLGIRIWDLGFSDKKNYLFSLRSLCLCGEINLLVVGRALNKKSSLICVYLRAIVRLRVALRFLR
jgi:hypothetical protein